MEDKCLLDVQHSYVESLAIYTGDLSKEQHEAEADMSLYLIRMMRGDYAAWADSFRIIERGG